MKYYDTTVVIWLEVILTIHVPNFDKKYRGYQITYCFVATIRVSSRLRTVAVTSLSICFMAFSTSPWHCWPGSALEDDDDDDEEDDCTRQKTAVRNMVIAILWCSSFQSLSTCYFANESRCHGTSTGGGNWRAQAYVHTPLSAIPRYFKLCHEGYVTCLYTQLVYTYWFTIYYVCGHLAIQLTSQVFRQLPSNLGSSQPHPHCFQSWERHLEDTTQAVQGGCHDTCLLSRL